MGENLEADGRHAVRTPMQWNNGKNGGFSTARRGSLPAPVTDGGYAPEFVNADDQVRDQGSLLNFMRLLISRYRTSPEIGWGELTMLDQPHDCVLAHQLSGPLGSMIALHNFSGEAVSVPIEIEGGDEDTRLLDLLQDGSTVVSAKGTAELALGPYGYRWLRVTTPGHRRIG